MRVVPKAIVICIEPLTSTDKKLHQNKVLGGERREGGGREGGRAQASMIVCLIKCAINACRAQGYSDRATDVD